MNPVEQELHELSYSLAKRVPDMARGFVIVTNYGEIVIDAADAAPFAALAEATLRAQFVKAEQREALARCAELMRHIDSDEFEPSSDPVTADGWFEALESAERLVGGEKE